MRTLCFMEKEQKQLCEDAEDSPVNSGYNQTVEQQVSFFFVPFIFSFIFKKVSITYIPKKHLKRKK